MANPRIYAIVVFFRRHAWRFALALGSFALIAWLVLSIPRFMTFGSKLKGVKNATSAPSSSPEKTNVSQEPELKYDFPLVRIACRDGVYTDAGYFILGSRLGNYRLSSYEYSSCRLTWEYINEKNEVLSTRTCNWLGVVPKDSPK